LVTTAQKDCLFQNKYEKTLRNALLLNDYAVFSPTSAPVVKAVSLVRRLQREPASWWKQNSVVKKCQGFVFLLISWERPC